MRHLPSHIALLIFAAACLWPSAASAQEKSDTTKLEEIVVQHSYGHKTTSLRLGIGAGYAIYRDLGTAPISFKGLALQPVVGLELGGMRRWTTTVDAFTSVAILEDAVKPKFNFGSFGISNTLRFKMKRHITSLWSLESEDKLYLGHNDKYPLGHKKHYVFFSAGFGAANFLDVTVNPDYENAAAGVSDFIGPELSLRADLYLNTIFNSYDIDKADKQMHCEIGLMPLAAVLRPGYSYIDNYTAAQPVMDALFDDYEWHIKPFAALYTDIGLDIWTGPYNRISVSYLWTYRSSGNSGQWRFDHASHLLHIDFIVLLKSKRSCSGRIIKL